MKTLPQSINELSSQKSINKWSGAVNLVLIEGEILFIKRSELMPSHKGQIAFMGGYKNENESPIECALREFSEESTLSTDILNPLGLLRPVQTSHGSLIIPVLSKANISKHQLLSEAKSNGEWDELFTVSKTYFEKKSRWVSAKWLNFDGKSGDIFFCPLEKESIYTKNELKSIEYLLWGVTAQMMWDFIHR